MYSEMYLTTHVKAPLIRDSQVCEEKKTGCSCEGSGAVMRTPPVTCNSRPLRPMALENEITAFHWILIVF